jgi:hypothetical protein
VSLGEKCEKGEKKEERGMKKQGRCKEKEKMGSKRVINAKIGEN